jgi:nitrite reductase (NADH) small subunit
MIGEWLDIGPVDQFVPGSARTLKVQGGEDIAVFRTEGNKFHALVNACPHKRGPLSQGIVHGGVVTCPLHNWNISLTSGEALGDDKGCVPVIPLRVDAGRIYLLRSALVAHSATDQKTPAHSATDRQAA